MRFSLAVIAAVLLAPVSALRAQCSPYKREEARTEAQALLKANATNDVALECMGRTYMDEGKSGDAVDWLEKAVKANDNSAQHHLWLGNALGTEAQNASKLRQPFLARRCKTEFERAVALDPTLVEARVSLVQFYVFAPGIMGGSDEKAQDQVREIAKYNPMRAHLESAFIAEQRKDTAADERELLAALRAGPDSLAPYLQLGGFYGQRRRWDDAFTTYDKLLQVKPDFVTAHFLYGRTAAFSGKNLERGAREMTFFLANMPPSTPAQTGSVAHLRLGMIREQLGARDAARAEYQTAVSLNPNNEEAKKALAKIGRQ